MAAVRKNKKGRTFTYWERGDAPPKSKLWRGDGGPTDNPYFVPVPGYDVPAEETAPALDVKQSVYDPMQQTQYSDIPITGTGTKSPGVPMSDYNVMTMLQVPQAAVVGALTKGKHVQPSEALSIKNPIAAFATDAILDPTNLIPAAGIAKVVKGGKQIATKADDVAEAMVKSQRTPTKVGASGEYNEEGMDQMLQMLNRKLNMKDFSYAPVDETFDAFKTRIRTPEGQARAKALGIREDRMEEFYDYMDNLKLKEDPYTYAYYEGDALVGGDKIAFNPSAKTDITPQFAQQVMRHELEHAVQKSVADFSRPQRFIPGTKTPATYPSQPTKLDKYLEAFYSVKDELATNPNWDDVMMQNANTIKNMEDLAPAMNKTQKALDYYLTGSSGQEKSAMLGELQEYLRLKGVDPYDISSADVKQAHMDFIGTGKMQDQPLRIFKIMKRIAGKEDEGYEVLSNALKQMLGIAPVGLVGGAALNQQ